MSMVKSIRAAVEIIGRALALFLIVFSTISYLVTLALGPLLFFSTTDGLSVASRRIPEIPIDLFMAFTVPVPLAVSLGGLFMGVWVAFVLCVVLAWFSRDGFPSSIKGALTQSISIAKTNFLFIMPLVAPALLYSTIIIQQFQETQGVKTGSLSFPPQTSPYVILVNLAFAPLREEFAFRVTSIGIPLGIFLVFLYRYDSRISSLRNRVKLILLVMLSPDRAKLKMGYKNLSANGFPRGISPLEWALILLTSTIFGLAHYLLGGGWDVGKISTAFLAGLVFGIMFVAYGAYASILLHWFFNYYFTIIDLADSTYGGFFQVFSYAVERINLVAGQIILVVFLLVSALKLADYLTMRAAGLGNRSDQGV